MPYIHEEIVSVARHYMQASEEDEMKKQSLKTFATTDRASGFLWWVGQASDARDACRRSDADGGGVGWGCSYGAITRSEFMHGGGGGYAVRVVPRGRFEDADGQSASVLEALEEYPVAGYFESEEEGE